MLSIPLRLGQQNNGGGGEDEESKHSIIGIDGSWFTGILTHSYLTSYFPFNDLWDLLKLLYFVVPIIVISTGFLLLQLLTDDMKSH